ncbi:MAG: 23S rRNA (adenine(2503)-C(2))-methyltransferase RlmN [bacterium]|nr:23S rRNA (adenine(2503)-C(2))-methyltransferase RlmN [bacterium]
MDMQLDKIKNELEQQGEKNFRINQVRDAWYTEKGWDEISTLSKNLKDSLADNFPWSSIVSSKVYTSKNDDTKKALLTLEDGQKIETVFMDNARDTKTVCISSQIGCAMACTFCATGTMGMKRNLSADEIVDQVRFWRMNEPELITNIVFMGMGEPMANYDSVKRAANIFIDEMEIGPTRITLSTVGIPVGLQRILDDNVLPSVRVAFSLHAGTDATRSSIVPSHRMTSMQKIVDWTDQYLRIRGNRRHFLTFEYVMLHDINDMPSEAEAFVNNFARFGSGVKLNLIPWNHTDANLRSSSEERLREFKAITEEGGIVTMIRYSKGLDIDAACGQLLVKDEAVKK